MKNFDTENENFKQLFHSLQPRLYAYCRKYIDDSELAKDIVQECFVHIWEKWKSILKRVYIRQGAVTKPASKDEERLLNSISIISPFDDRMNHHASIHGLDKELMIEFLYGVNSDLYKGTSNLNYS